jgi:WD40 repeat protein
MNQPPRVFISYARSDGEQFATELRQRLERDEPAIALWQDRTRMEGGKDWWRQIIEALDAVEFMVLVMTPDALCSPVVRKEWQAARQRGICVYPVMGVPDLDFGAMPRWMSRAHFFDIEKEWQTFVNYLKSPCRAVRTPFMAPDLPEGYIERTGLLSQLLDATVDEAHEAARPGAAVLYGAGGFGKTTLAAALCHHDAVLTAYDAGVLWVTLGKQPNLLTELTALYAALTDERPGFASEQDAAFHLAEKLGEANILLVIDDVWNAAHLGPFLRGGPGCTRLVATRQFEVAARFETRLEVYEMGTDEAARMLAARLPQAPDDLTSFRALASRLGEWPLMLELAGGALRQRMAHGDTLPGALVYLAQTLDRLGVVAFDQKDAVERNQALAGSMAVSLDLLAQKERRRYLELAIFPEDVDIPLSALGALWGMDDFETEALAERLADLLLLRYDLPGRAVRLHDVVRAYLAGQLDNPAALHTRLVESWGDRHHLPDAYAWHWIGYHLVGAGRADELRALLFDFAWLRAKLAACDANALVADCERLPKDAAAQRVGRALRQAAYVLAQDPAQLDEQLLGRLLDDPAPEVEDLLAQAVAAQQGPWLRPLQASLREPEALVRTLADHTSWVEGVAVTPDGRYAVSASVDKTLKVWELATGQAVRTLEGHTSFIDGVAVTPDGRYAISASDDKTLKVWKIAAARKRKSGRGASQAVHTLEGHTGGVTGVAVTPDGRYAISASYDTTLKVWDLSAALETGSPAPAAQTQASKGEGADSAAARKRKSGQDTSRAVATLAGHTAGVTAVAVTPDGCYAISASDDQTLKVWDLSAARKRKASLAADRKRKPGRGTSQAVATLAGHMGRVKGVAVTPDGRYAISASDDQTLKVWDLSAARKRKPGPDVSQAVATLAGHMGRVTGVAVTPDGRYAVSASADKTLKVWDLSAALKTSLSAALKAGLSAALKTDLSAALKAGLPAPAAQTGAGPGTSQAVATLDGHMDRVSGVAVTSDGRYAISASYDTTLKVWDLRASQAVHPLEGHTDRVTGVAVTPDGRSVVSASWDKTLKVWDLSAARKRKTSLAAAHKRKAGPGTSQVVHTLEGHTDFVRGVAVTPDGHYAISASSDRTLKVWDLHTAQAVHILEGHTDWVRAVAVTSDGRYAVSASDDQALKVWDLSAALKASLAADRKRKSGPGTSQAVATLAGHASLVLGVAVTPDGRYAVSASMDRMLKVWDLPAARKRKPGPPAPEAQVSKSKGTGQAVHTLAGHTDSVMSVAVTPDGRYAVSASWDQTLVVWDLASGRAVRSLEGHTSGVAGVAVTPDGRCAVSASYDKTLRVWELESGQLLASFYAGEPLNACAVAPDGVTIVAGGVSGRLHFLRLEGLERAATGGYLSCHSERSGAE